jgi:hypothetical protein
LTAGREARNLALPSHTRQTLIDYARGPIVLISAILLLLIISAYGTFGEWKREQVLALSLGMTGGMLISNGFGQAMARRGSIFLSLEDSAAASRFLRLSATVTGTCVAAIAIIVLLIMTYTGTFNSDVKLTFSLAFVALAAIWFVAAGLSLLQATGWLLIGLAAGSMAGVLTDRVTALFSEAHLVLGTIAGFTLALGLMLKAMNRGLNVKSNGSPSQVVLPPAAFLVYEATPYFAYGMLYMTLILVPHILGWYGMREEQQAGVWVMTSVELGLVLSFFPLTLAGGVAEHAFRLVWLQAGDAQKVTSGTEPDRFGTILSKSYRRQLRLYLAILFGCSLVAFLLFRASVSSGLLSIWMPLSNLDAVEFIFEVGLVAYWLVGWGAFNCMFCVNLARPGMALRAVAWGVGVLLIVGIPLSIGINFTFIAVAFVIGAAAFAAASARAMRQLLQSADYFYFASF